MKKSSGQDELGYSVRACVYVRAFTWGYKLSCFLLIGLRKMGSFNMERDFLGFINELG